MKYEATFEEPMRAIVITQPRQNVLRIFYNQATPDGKGHFKIVNSFDNSTLRLFKMPLLPDPMTVYKDFKERVIHVPVIHSPPWYFVSYSIKLDKINGKTNIIANKSTVVGGRDFHLLKLLAKKMNFKIEYLDPPVRTQGAAIANTSDNIIFSGALGMLQRREAEMLLGDVALTYERSKVTEFSFFTLADSGAFATHAPKRLNEALALVRPFRWEVWPLLLITILISGPALCLIIYIPSKWELERLKEIEMEKRIVKKKRKKMYNKNQSDNKEGFLHLPYLHEMQYGIKNVNFFNRKVKQKRNKLFASCIWYTITLFLKQSCTELHPGYRTKFVSTILWLAATYVLADVYSAQLTSQLARPAREAPINTLQKLEVAMKNKGYQLYVERQSSSLNTLENGTEIFKKLYKLMEHQQGGKNHNNSYLVSSVEEGISLIIDGALRAILGGRETLFFNMKRYGIQNFQLSEKLYTRYSAVALQIGCPFKESLNDVLIHLFEGGILEKMTNAEYENMFKLNQTDGMDENMKSDNPGMGIRPHSVSEPKMQPLNLRMLQGAFIALGLGYCLAGLNLYFEYRNISAERSCGLLDKIWKNVRKFCKRFSNKCLKGLVRYHRRSNETLLKRINREFFAKEF